MSTEVNELISKAAKAEKADEAMKFSQAALNAANAFLTVKTMERESR